ncbi:MAG: tetratricopeptide repeat protein [Alphaproteobacteria bacterium]|nr:tetratricopeptide repeat protein [Alphaproteobacteria bacterium]
MSDIFREVEEEVRRDRLEKLWKQYGDYIVAAAALLILAAAAYRLWTYYESRERARASNEYLAAQQLLQAGQDRAAAEQFARLAKNAPRGYAKLAQLQEADALSAMGNTAAALANYRKLIDGGDDMLASIARIRVAWILVEGAPKAEVEQTLEGLAAEGSPWRPVAREILAYADYRAGAIQPALAAYQKLAKDTKAPQGVQLRANAMATFILAGGNKDVGKPLYTEMPGKIVPTGRRLVAGAAANSNTPAANAPPSPAASTPAPGAAGPASTTGTQSPPAPKGPAPK